MFISSCQITNYKGFDKSPLIKFTPGFNVIVGQNNAGKTALLELLSLEFEAKPHKRLSRTYEGASIITMGIKLGVKEGYDYLRKLIPCSISQRFEKYGNAHFPQIQQYFDEGYEIRVEFQNGKLQNSRLSGVIYNPSMPRLMIGLTTDNKITGVPAQSGNEAESVGMPIAIDFKKRCYIFRAERLNIHRGPIGTNTTLASNANNLPQVLNVLQSQNRARYQRFVNSVRTVFPDIQDVAINLVTNNEVEIRIWFVPPDTERSDLAVPLSDCGTGIGQVLAMLYVVINSDEPRTILIDEPQSFLHPGAIRKLFEIFKKEVNQKHQYIITTHSPTVVTACSPCNVIWLHRQDSETKAETIDVNETESLRLFLSEIGARLSDVFGADRILWVEGRTEEICFKHIAQKLLKMELVGTDILAVTNPGDFSGRHKKLVWEIYEKLSKGHGLLPPALGFSFDREVLSQAEMDELNKNSGGLIEFIPRRMYENYLLNPKAVVEVLNESDIGKTREITEDMVNNWLNANKLESKYISDSEKNEWLKNVDGAKLLNDLFNVLTEARVVYDKIKHGLKLTAIIIEKYSGDFDELKDFLRMLLSK